ncbi:CLUMA_CG008938, isoform A [Clunio marinus]|uniref:CLUMA_CG008938, isoform A n=1 Tax=Clunio marinus TaxID=568069 RepID=A0A1J1I5A3_9DIPT|nr:CLUMA_CG008938, isoform A [Clunio marinus]
MKVKVLKVFVRLLNQSYEILLKATSFKQHVKIETEMKENYTYVGLDIDTSSRRLIDESLVNGYDSASEKHDRIGIPYLNFCENVKLQRELQLLVEEKKEDEPEKFNEIANEFIREKSFDIQHELEEITKQKVPIKNRSSLEKCFRSYFQTSRFHRVADKGNRDYVGEKEMDYVRVKLLNVSAQDQERID